MYCTLIVNTIFLILIYIFLYFSSWKGFHHYNYENHNYPVSDLDTGTWESFIVLYHALQRLPDYKPDQSNQWHSTYFIWGFKTRSTLLRGSDHYKWTCNEQQCKHLQCNMWVTIKSCLYVVYFTLWYLLCKCVLLYLFSFLVPNPPGPIMVDFQTVNSINFTWSLPDNMDYPQYNFSVSINGTNSSTLINNNWFLLRNLSSGSPYSLSIRTVGVQGFLSTAMMTRNYTSEYTRPVDHGYFLQILYIIIILFVFINFTDLFTCVCQIFFFTMMPFFCNL